MASDDRIGQWLAYGWIIEAGLIDLVVWSLTCHRLVNDWHIVRGLVEWSRIGSGLVDWWIGQGLALIGELVMYCQIGDELVEWSWIGRLAKDLHRIDIGLADWQCLGRLAMDWLI